MDSRISRHQMFQEIAQVVSKRSTCFRESVGAIIVKNNRIISMGYNGAPKGEEHCTFHPQGKCDISTHAEENAIKFAGPQRERSCDLYVTHLPCKECANLIRYSRIIKRVFFTTMYGDPEPVYELLNKDLQCKNKYHSIPLFRVLPSGVITSYNREEILCLED